jgi:hypothetical protein
MPLRQGNLAMVMQNQDRKRRRRSTRLSVLVVPALFLLMTPTWTEEEKTAIQSIMHDRSIPYDEKLERLAELGSAAVPELNDVLCSGDKVKTFLAIQALGEAKPRHPVPGAAGRHVRRGLPSCLAIAFGIPFLLVERARRRIVAAAPLAHNTSMFAGNAFVNVMRKRNR